jgi:hypothetical protein
LGVPPKPPAHSAAVAFSRAHPNVKTSLYIDMEGAMAFISLRVTDEQKMRARDDADAAGMSVNRYAVNRIFGRAVIAHADMVMVKELRRQGGLLKRVHIESKGAYSAETAAAIRSIQILIDKLAAPKEKS